jgi:hypothetical protein
VTAIVLREDAIVVRRCRRCGCEWPAYLSSCRACAAALGDPIPREILIAVPQLRLGELPPEILPVVAAALELSGDPNRPDALRSAAAEATKQLLAALPSSAVVGGLPNGVLAAVVADETLAESAAAAARAVTAVDVDGVEPRAGIGIGLADGLDPLAAAVTGHAARLARAAAAGQRLCSYAVARLLDRDWQFAPTGVLARREQDRVEAVAALLGRKRPAPTPSALAVDHGPPLIGRGQELAALDRELARARAGDGGWCAVVAPAGAGKSKLLRSWLTRIDRGAVTVVGAAGSPFGQAPRALVDRLLDTLSAPPRRDDALAALVAGIDASARPLVLVVDDLHWADGESLTVLRRLADVSLDRCLVILALRTSFLPRVGWLAGTAHVVEVPPLTEREHDALLRELLPEPGLRPTVDRSPEARNPLYLEHAAALVREEGADAAVPPSLHEVVLRRLERVLARVEARPSAEELRAIEHTAGEWLDRLETEDYEDRAAIARYLGLLERIDAALVIAGSIAGVPQHRNRRLAAAIDRFYSASFAERVEAIERLAATDPAAAGRAAAAGAVRALRAARIDDAFAYLEIAERFGADEDRARARRERDRIVAARRSASAPPAVAAAKDVRAAAASLVFESDPVADLAALVRTARLLAAAAPDAVGETLRAETELAAQRLGSASAPGGRPPKIRRYESSP